MGDVTYIDSQRKEITNTTDSLSDVVHCLMITLTNETLLLPNAAVAEVVSFTSPEPLDGSPNWFLGRITWRERLVPLISFEDASITVAETPDVLQGSRIAILNTLNGNAALPYVAIVVQGIPRLSVIKNDSITTIEAKPQNRQSVAEIVDVEGQSLVIPDIDDLEKRLQSLHS